MLESESSALPLGDYPISVLLDSGTIIACFHSKVKPFSEIYQPLIFNFVYTIPDNWKFSEGYKEYVSKSIILCIPIFPIYIHLSADFF